MIKDIIIHILKERTRRKRANDGIERSAEQWFRRYNAKAPSPGLTPSPIFALKHFTS